MEAVAAVRRDLKRASKRLESLGSSLANEGYHLSPLRILEVLVWTETEPWRGYSSLDEM